MFVTHGYALTSVNQIAALAGVDKHTVYRRFPSKDSLFAAACIHEIDRLINPDWLGLDEPEGPAQLEAIRLACKSMVVRNG